MSSHAAVRSFSLISVIRSSVRIVLYRKMGTTCRVPRISQKMSPAARPRIVD